MNFDDIWNTSQEECYILLNKRVLPDSFLLYVQYGVKMLIPLFLDTEFNIPHDSTKCNQNSIKPVMIMTQKGPNRHH